MPADRVLAFRRGQLGCVVNLNPEQLSLDTLGLPGRPVLSSAPLSGNILPPDTAVWLTTKEEGRRSQD